MIRRLMLGMFDAAPSAGGKLLLDGSHWAESCEATAGEHGSERLAARVRRPFREAFRFLDQQQGLPWLGLVDGGQIVWEGRLEDPGLQAGSQGSGLLLQALGAWRSLSDDRYTALWSKTTLDGFRPIRDTELAGAMPDRYEFDTNSRLYIAPRKNSTLGTTGGAKLGMLVFQLPDDSTRDIIGAQFAFTYTFPAANWRVAFQTRNDDFSGIANAWIVTVGGAGTVSGAVHVTFAAARIVDAFLDFNAADAVYAGETGANFLRITRLRLVTSTANRVNTTLTANRNAGTNVTATVGSTSGMYVGMELVIDSTNANSEIVTVLSIGSSTQFNATFANNHTSGQAVQGFRILADEIAKDIVSQVATLNSSQLSASTSLIQSPGLDLLNQSFEDADMAEVLTRLAALGDNQTPPRRWEVGVLDGRRLHFRPEGDAARSWVVDVTDLEIARSLEALANKVYAVYKDAAGRALRAAATTDAASVLRAGVTRRTAVSADTTSTIEAGVIQAAALADAADPIPRASIRFERLYDASGGRWPVSAARPGDTLTIRNLPQTVSGGAIDRVRTWRIAHTSYDPVAGTLDLEPAIPIPSLETLLARRAEGF
jgi:hypothetical protein